MIVEVISFLGLLYNVLSCIFLNMSVETMVRFFVDLNIVGIKEVSADLEQISRII